MGRFHPRPQSQPRKPSATFACFAAAFPDRLEHQRNPHVHRQTSTRRDIVKAHARAAADTGAALRSGRSADRSHQRVDPHFKTHAKDHHGRRACSYGQPAQEPAGLSEEQGRRPLRLIRSWVCVNRPHLMKSLSGRFCPDRLFVFRPEAELTWRRCVIQGVRVNPAGMASRQTQSCPGSLVRYRAFITTRRFLCPCSTRSARPSSGQPQRHHGNRRSGSPVHRRGRRQH